MHTNKLIFKKEFVWTRGFYYYRYGSNERYRLANVRIHSVTMS